MMKATLLIASLLATTVVAQAAPTLAKVYRKDFLIGAALGGTLPTDYNKAELAMIKREINTYTPENSMKPANVQPQEGKWQFEQADALIAFAKKNRVPVYGHTLVWHQQSPKWFHLDGDKPASRELSLERLRTHIHTVAGRYRGKVVGWDVVNEAISDKVGEYLRPSGWLATIGEDYIAHAFRFAHEADPDAELQYNDYSIEGPAKRAKTLKLLKQLLADGVPVHSVGIQGHWSLDYMPLEEIDIAIREFGALGLKVSITELDIDVMPRTGTGADLDQQEKLAAMTEAKPMSPEVEQRQAELYGKLFAILRKHRDVVTRVTFWGPHDGRSWLNKWPTERYNHALIFDRDAKPKRAAYEAILKAAKK